MSTNTAPGLARIGQIGVSVRDLAAATRFYRDVLGLQFLFDAPGMSFFDCDGVRLMLAKPERAELDHAASILYFRVADIGASCAALKARGVHFEGEPLLVARLPTHDLWLASFRDPENNVLALMSEVPRT